MSARILNLNVIQAIWDFLRLQGPEGPPNVLNQDDLKVVLSIPLDVPPQGLTTKTFVLTSLPIGGTNEVETPFISRGEDGSYDMVGKNYRMMSLSASIRYTAAGAIAAAGSKIGVAARLLDYVGGSQLWQAYNYDNAKTVDADITNYRFTIGSSVSGDIVWGTDLWKLFIGPELPVPGGGQGFGITMQPHNVLATGVLANFPAGTVMDLSAQFYECIKPFYPPI